MKINLQYSREEQSDQTTKKKDTKELTLEQLPTLLGNCAMQIKVWHWQSTTRAQHKEFDALYEMLLEFQDRIAEVMLGHGRELDLSLVFEPYTNFEEIDKCIVHVRELEEKISKISNIEENEKDIENILVDLQEGLNKSIYLLHLQ